MTAQVVPPFSLSQKPCWQKKHPVPITLLFPIAEENGLHGSRMVRFSDLGNPAMGFNLDGQEPNEIVIGAMSAARWQATITGISSMLDSSPQRSFRRSHRRKSHLYHLR